MTENSLLLMTWQDTDGFWVGFGHSDSWRVHSWSELGAGHKATLRPFKNPALRSVQNVPARPAHRLCVSPLSGSCKFLHGLVIEAYSFSDKVQRTVNILSWSIGSQTLIKGKNASMFVFDKSICPFYCFDCLSPW